MAKYNLTKEEELAEDISLSLMSEAVREQYFQTKREMQTADPNRKMSALMKLDELGYILEAAEGVTPEGVALATATLRLAKRAGLEYLFDERDVTFQ